MTLPFNILGFDHIHMIVGNAKQACVYYQKLYGFQPVAYQGLETGERTQTSYVVQQGDIRLVLTSPLTKDSELNEHLRLHGDGVKNIALRVDNVQKTWEYATQNGAESLSEPQTISDEHGKVTIAKIKAFGDVVHSFVERDAYNGPFMPGYTKLEGKATSAGLEFIDHVVSNHALGQMENIVNWYQKTLGFKRFWSADDEDISTDYSALRSIVVASENEKVKMPINEPAEGKRKSQIEEFLDFYSGPGVQHLAVVTSDIIATIQELGKNGVEFLSTPKTYYESLAKRVGNIDEGIETLEKWGILVDRDEQGYMLQIFTKPVQDRPTLFIEIIQRKGSSSFGKGNFKALFESIEKEQERRGNL